MRIAITWVYLRQAIASIVRYPDIPLGEDYTGRAIFHSISAYNRSVIGPQLRYTTAIEIRDPDVLSVKGYSYRAIARDEGADQLAIDRP